MPLASSRKTKARALRRNMTDAEHKLWYLLRSRRLSNAKFRRQVPIGPYIADFLSYDTHVIVEADGSQHIDSARDQDRDNWLRSQGYTVLRFSNHDILGNPDGVLTQLKCVLDAWTPHPAPSAPPSPARGEGKLLRRARRRANP